MIIDLMSYSIAYCINCEEPYVCAQYEIHGTLEDLTNGRSYLETTCNDCDDEIDREQIWIDANGYYIMNGVFHQDIEGR